MVDISQIRPKDKVAAAAPYYELLENDQTFPAGMYRIIATGDTLDFQRATAVDWSTVTSLLTLDGGNGTITLGVTSGFADDVLFTLGSGDDIVMLNRSTILGADTVLANVLEGTVESQAIAANSLMISNITDDGDIAMYVNKGGNSQMVFWADGSTGDTAIMAASGQSVDMYIGGSKVFDITNNGTTTRITGLSGDYFSFGSGNSSQGFTSENDTYFTGKIEVDGNAYLDAILFVNGTIDALTNIRLRDDVQLQIGLGVDSVLIYETADTNALQLVLCLPHVDEAANNVAVLALVDRDALGIDLGAAGLDFSGITEPTLAIGNEATNAYCSLDAGDSGGAGKGLYFKAAADEDINILKLSVTGTPTIIWDESATAWLSTGANLEIGTQYFGLTEMAAPGAGAANTARIYALEGAGDAFTDLCAVFQDGSIDVFAQEVTEPDSPIFQFPDATELTLTMRKPDRKTIQFVATFPDGRDFVMREIRYPTERWN